MNDIFLFDALREATDEEMEKDKSVFVLGEDVGHYGGSYKVTKNLHSKYGDLRVLDTPIAENSFMGMAIGASMTGLRPIVEGMNMSFLLLAFNQISNNAGMLRYTSGGNFNIPLVIRGPGGVGRQLGAEHSQRLESYFQSIPGLKIVSCSTPYNAKGLLKSAIRDDNPVIFFEHVLLYNIKQSIPSKEYFLPLNKAELVKSGWGVTILTYSRMRHCVMQAISHLKKEGYDPEVLDLISLKPIDIESIVISLKKTHRLLIVEECMKTGGIAAEIIAQINDNYFNLLDAPILRLSSEDIPTPYNGKLESNTIVNPQKVIDAVKILSVS
uniref:Pyruvate dehydrogenase E1 component subunit beta n=1 Tax=Platysiphonia delicata TaxID=2006979 RepID=A0A1Z1M0K1_9FLOR|nr:pyruvate dehydrogenase E1 component beta subunit [Platysiphonia delicata]ARW59599.1 pyruvate dehydrogenase E1 component beta subunit [Platysiphonia delicata]